jgi:hypothetical protein
MMGEMACHLGQLGSKAKYRIIVNPSVLSILNGQI